MLITSILFKIRALKGEPMKPLRECKSHWVNLFVVSLLLIASNNTVRAQVSASFSGRIDDPSGAAIPGANVTVTSSETGATRGVTTDETGNYRVLSLPV